MEDLGAYAGKFSLDSYSLCGNLLTTVLSAANSISKADVWGFEEGR